MTDWPNYHFSLFCLLCGVLLAPIFDLKLDKHPSFYSEGKQTEEFFGLGHEDADAALGRGCCQHPESLLHISPWAVDYVG